MKASVLTSVMGMPVESAVDTIKAHGYIPEVYDHRAIIPAIARPGIVILLECNDIVQFVQAGDPLEVVKD